MFKYQVHALAMQKVGFGRPLGCLFLVILLGCIIVGLIYAAVFIHALNDRSHPPHVHARSSQ
jgi:hypothetical protein